MAKLCIKCNTPLSDQNAMLCTSCEDRTKANKVNHQQLYAKKRKSFQSAMASSLSEIEVDDSFVDLDGDGEVSTQSASGQNEPDWGRCTICFKQFYGVGSYCGECSRKLDRSTDEWELQQQENIAKRNGIIRTTMVSMCLFLVVLSVGLSVASRYKNSGDSDLEPGTSNVTVQYDDLLNAEHNALGAAEKQGIDQTATALYVKEFQSAGLSRIASYEFLQYMCGAATNSSQVLPTTIPTAVGAIKFAHGNAQVATSIVDTITKYSTTTSGIWDTAARAAAGQQWPATLNNANNSDLTTALTALLESAPHSPKVVAPSASAPS